jgi:hypothetical protein
MNERILELAKEAGMIYGQGNLDDFDMLTYMPKEVRFAELIVRECAEQIKTHGISASSEDYGDYEIGFNAGLFHALRTTKEHFGVKE